MIYDRDPNPADPGAAPRLSGIDARERELSLRYGNELKKVAEAKARANAALKELRAYRKKIAVKS